MAEQCPYRDGTTQILQSTDAVCCHGAVLEVLCVAASPRIRRLSKGGVVLGAGLAADIVIDEPSVSRRHSQISVSALGVEVTDLGSRNGTFFQGQRVDRITLDRDATIQLGNVHVRVALMQPHSERDDSEPMSYGEVRGACRPMQGVIRTLERLSGSAVPLLVVGESGTGKELVARAAHEHSAMSKGSFLALNCGALERGLARSELFGHKRGAFTGAVETRLGAFELAHGGTLFLDEIGELPLEVQPLLLRALETGIISRIGEAQERSVNVRLIAATHRDLSREVGAGRFREDLFYRLNVVKVELPALRDRGGDIELLAHQFAAEFGIRHLSSEILEHLRRYHWPGNVRELRNVLRGYAAVGVLPEPKPSDCDAGFDQLLRLALDLDRPYQEQKDRLLNKFIDVYLAELLRRTHGNQSEAARIAGLDRAHLNKMVMRLRRGAASTGSLERCCDTDF